MLEKSFFPVGDLRCSAQTSCWRLKCVINIDNSRCLGHNKGNYKCSKTTWWTQGKTTIQRRFPSLSFNAPPFQQETVIWYSSLAFPRCVLSFVLRLRREARIRLLKTFRIQSVIERRDWIAIGQLQKRNADVHGTTAGLVLSLFLILMNFWAGWRSEREESERGMLWYAPVFFFSFI